MPVHNADIARVFESIADLLEINGDNPFRIRAYRNAARVMGGLGLDVAAAVKGGRELPKLPGIGPDLTGKLHEIAETGTCKLLRELERKVPAAITELLKIPGLGPKRVKQLHDALDVSTVKDLQAALREGRVRKLKGFGEKTEARIRQALAQGAAGGGERMLLATAAQYAEAFAGHLAKARGIEKVTVAGSYRRMRETVGDLDILVAARDGGAVVDRFCGYDEVKEVTARGETRAAVVLKSGLQVDLRLVPPESYGAALHYFTGSKAHNIAVRKLGQAKGLKINEYGVFRGKKHVAGRTEESVFDSVGLPYIAPELREGSGELEAARRGKLPGLIELGDLRGDLHAHTKASDGHNTIREMAEGARSRGLAYLAITDHSQRLKVAHGLDSRRLGAQLDEIDRINEGLKNFTILKGAEVDILEDGSLDFPDAVLKRLDLVIGAVHSAFALPRRKQTDRVLRAIDRRCFTVLAHPSARLIGSREAIDIDMARVIRAARSRGCFLELNAQPERLDLNDAHCRMAAEEGVLIALSSDAHSVPDLDNLRFGVGQARRGWLTAKQVLNTRPLKELRPLLKKTMAG